jgi:hypothetical protein
MLRNIDGGPLGGADGDPGAPTINAKNIDGGPLVGADEDPRAPTINVQNVDGGLPGRCQSCRCKSVHHQY